MKKLRRVPAPLVAVITLATCLSACSDDSEPSSDTDASSQTCRLVAVTHASLDGPRGSMASGWFTPGAMAAYDTAMAQLGTAVSAEDEPDEEITQSVIALVAAYSRTRAFADENADASSYQSNQVKALTAAEVRLYGELVEVCPVLDDTDDD
ncbi:MAG: hypothetical protein Q8O61_11840 [Nocardioides sp.]|nr:hypothetical protein [Nocardioides sp.]